MNKTFLTFGAIFGLLAVSIGAFGSHALKEILESSGNTDTFQTGVRYQFYHALALMITGILSKEFRNKWMKYAGMAFIAGIIFFSGSLYLICFTDIKAFGAVAPIGGLFFVSGWIFLILSFRDKA